MKRLMVVCLLLFFSGGSYGQALKKYVIDKGGCSASFYCNPGTFELSKSPDSADVYTGECNVKDVNYGLICVKLKTGISELQLSEDVLIQYLDYLKTTLNIASARGYGKGHKLHNKENTRGVVDYWQDKEGNNWKLRGWTNGKYIAVLFVYTPKEVPEANAEVFLNSLMFPAK